MGKAASWLAKIAATSVPRATALFLHPVEPVHGDLGMVVPGDVVIALSYSGETEEILRLLATIKRLRFPLISMTGDALCNGAAKLSTLASAAEVALDCSIDKEPVPWALRRPLLRPPCSLWAMRRRHDFRTTRLQEEDFADCIPAASSASSWHGRHPHATPVKLCPVAPGPKCGRDFTKMSRKKLGVAAVVADGKLSALSVMAICGASWNTAKRCARSHRRRVHTRDPKTIGPQEFAATAAGHHGRKENYSLAVVVPTAACSALCTMHDLWGTEMV